MTAPLGASPRGIWEALLPRARPPFLMEGPHSCAKRGQGNHNHRVEVSTSDTKTKDGGWFTFEHPLFAGGKKKQTKNIKTPPRKEMKR